jgi:hypothetical protein
LASDDQWNFATSFFPLVLFWAREYDSVKRSHPETPLDTLLKWERTLATHRSGPMVYFVGSRLTSQRAVFEVGFCPSNELPLSSFIGSFVNVE